MQTDEAELVSIVGDVASMAGREMSRQAGKHAVST